MTPKEKIAEVASRLGVDPTWLDALIRFETAGTYSPTIKNKYSSARGLIQIIDSTAYDLFGMSAEALVTKYPTFADQMESVVYPYLKRYRPFPTKQSLYMAVFYPAYRTVPTDTMFPATVRSVNPGIDTVSDYIRYVEGEIRPSGVSVSKPLPLLFLLAGAAATVYYLARNRSRTFQGFSGILTR